MEMSYSVDWQKIKTQELFDELVNFLLKEELGWAQISVSKGRDGATDVLFQGTYKKKSGKWVFQYKWRTPSTNKGKSIKEIERKLFKGDKNKEPELPVVRKNHNPDHYVLVSNLKFTQKNKTDYKNQAKKLGFQSFEVWDVADLSVFISKYPSAQRFYFDNKQRVLQRYQERFSEDLLDEESAYYCGTESQFLGRESQIKELVNFVNKDSMNIVMLCGRGGVGKTRLTIELAKKLDETDKQSRVYFLNDSKEVTFEDILSELPLSNIDKNVKNILILDDAYIYSDTLLPQLSRLTSKDSPYNAKYILITRPELKDQVNYSITPRELKGLKEIEIKNLIISERIKIINHHIKDRDLARDIASWAKKGSWSVLETILMILEAKRTGKSFLESLRESPTIDSLFFKYTRPLSSSARELLEVISFVQPFVLTREKRKFIREFLDWKELNFQKILSEIKATNLISVRSWGKIESVRLKPDIMGNWLRDKYSYHSNGKLKGEVKLLVRQLVGAFPEEILNNTVQTEYGKKEKILDNFIKKLKNEILKSNNNIRIDLLKLLKKIAWYRPNDCLDILGFIIKNPKKDYVHESLKAFPITNDHVLREIPDILNIIASHKGHFIESIKLLFKIYKIEGSYSSRKAREILLNLSKIIYRRPLDFNHKLLGLFKKNEALKRKHKDLFFEISKEQFIVSIHHSFWSLEDPRKFNFKEIPIRLLYKNDAHLKSLKKLRKGYLNLLFKYLKKSKQWEDHKKCFEIISLIVSGLYYQYASFGRRKLKNNEKYPVEDESTSIIEFVEKYVSEVLGSNENYLPVLNTIAESLLPSFKKSESALKNRAKKVQKSIKSSDKYSFYELLVGEHKDWSEKRIKKDRLLDYSYVKKIIRVSKNNCEDFLRFLNKILGLRKGWIFGSIKKLLVEIGEKNKDFSQKLIEELLSGKYKNIDIYGGYLIVGVRSNNFISANKIIASLLKRNSLKSLKFIAQSYDRHWVVDHSTKERQTINSNEIENLNSMLAKSDNELLTLLANASYVFLFIAREKALDLLLSISKKLAHDDYQIFSAIVATLDSKDFNFSQENSKIIEEITSEFVIIDDIDKGDMASWHLQNIFKTVSQFNPELVVSFFEKRIKRKNTTKKQDYDAVPYHLELPKLQNPELEAVVAKRICDWLAKNGWFQYEAPSFLKKYGFNPNTLQGVLMSYLSSDKDNKKKQYQSLLNTAHLLRRFDDNDWVYDVAAEILIQADQYKSNQRKYKNIYSEISAFIHTGGGSGYSKQLQVIAQIERILSKYSNRFSPDTKKRLGEEIGYQKEEASRMNDLLNSDNWE